MNLEKVIFSFFMILALTLNFGFFYGEVHNPIHHNVYELYAVIVINLIAKNVQMMFVQSAIVKTRKRNEQVGQMVC